jgi:hypothetical protein
VKALVPAWPDDLQILPVPGTTTDRRSLVSDSEGNRDMFKHGEQIVETSQEVRQAERGPTVRNVLVVSMGLVILGFLIIWLVFFGR